MNDTTSTSSRLLVNHRVWVVAPPEESQELIFWLEDEGAAVFAMPFLAHRESSHPSFRAAIEQLHRYSWMIVQDGVSAVSLAERVREADNWDWASKVKKVAVGENTAHLMTRARLAPQWTCEKDDELLAILKEHSALDQELLWLSANNAFPHWTEAFDTLGIRATVIETTRRPSELDETHLWSELRQFQANVVIVPSVAWAEALGEGLATISEQLLPNARWVANGESTAQALASKRLPIHEVAGGSSAHALIEAAVRALQESASLPCESASPL